MRSVGLGMVMAAASLVACVGLGHAQTCPYSFRPALDAPVNNRPALPAPANNRPAVSAPGPTCQATTWVSATMPAGVLRMDDIAYGNGLFVAVSGPGGGSARIITSADGITWVSSSTPVPTVGGFRDIA